ncbi:Exonuclease I [Spraguea lophii 42_110]|uniref:Exonuclease 1 n=1 Tax=Spraguea lophii (strain 42_110) TaxID=1358809 RepID=S7W9Z8_SPRLO|nr:Exonuclease I [Spraguea lophii 42_110]
MGITGLLPLIKPILVKNNIKKYKGYRIGIDGHAWLHQLGPIIAQDLYYRKTTDKHIHIIKRKLENLINLGITPIIVFDGDCLPSKEHTNVSRRERKDKVLEEIELKLSQGKKSEANELMKRCVSITPDLVSSLIERLDSEYIISPYESDAQLSYLQKIKYIDCILTEDSDMVVYGCDKILYKYDGMYVMEYDKSKLIKVLDQHFINNMLDICILSGCDYLKSVPGIGLKTAHKLMKKHNDVNAIIEELKIKKEVPENYYKEFIRAKMTFIHQVIFDPILNKRKYHSGEMMEGYIFLGLVDKHKPTIIKGLDELNDSVKTTEIKVSKEKILKKITPVTNVVKDILRKKVKRSNKIQ